MTFWFMRVPEASFNIFEGKNFWHLRTFLMKELMPRAKLTNEIVLVGKISTMMRL
jgi:hypothetical protein